MHCSIIGIDCATEDKKIGLARGSFENGRTTVHEAVICNPGLGPAGLASRWIENFDGRTLLAIDAPLGWPASLPLALAEHKAGDAIGVAANELFRRATDRHIKVALGKTPLDVGADRIARTAYAALRLLGDLRDRCDDPIPVAWTPRFAERIAAIEVYPAATLIAHGVRSTGYKQAAQRDARHEILHRLSRLAALPSDTSKMSDSADILDAAICVLAAGDFLAGAATSPPNVDLAVKEGWIWVKGVKSAL